MQHLTVPNTYRQLYVLVSNNCYTILASDNLSHITSLNIIPTDLDVKNASSVDSGIISVCAHNHSKYFGEPRKKCILNRYENIISFWNHDFFEISCTVQ